MQKHVLRTIVDIWCGNHDHQGNDYQVWKGLNSFAYKNWSINKQLREKESEVEILIFL